MQVNLLPNGNKKDKEKNDSQASVHEVPMSSPIPLDKSVVSETVELSQKSEQENASQVLNVPVARKYTTIETEDLESDEPPIPPQRDTLAPKFIRDRSGRKMPVVFAPRRTNNLSEPVKPKEKVEVSRLPHSIKKSEPDKMSETEVKNLKPSAKENFLSQFRRAEKQIETHAMPAGLDVPVINKIKHTVEQQVKKPKSLVSHVKRQSVASSVPMWAILVGALLVSIGLWQGVLYWHDTEAEALMLRAQELNGQVAASQLDAGAPKRLQAQLSALETWFDATPDYGHIFSLLEDTVLENVSYVSIKVSNTDVISLSGLAPDINSVAQQFFIFQDSTNVSSVKIVETNETEDDLVEFTFIVTLKKQNADNNQY